MVKIKTIKNRNSESRSRGREVERKRKATRQGFGHSEGKAKTQYYPTSWLVDHEKARGNYLACIREHVYVEAQAKVEHVRRFPSGIKMSSLRLCTSLIFGKVMDNGRQTGESVKSFIKLVLV